MLKNPIPKVSNQFYWPERPSILVKFYTIL